MGTVVAIILSLIILNVIRIQLAGYFEKSWKKDEAARLHAKNLFPNDQMLMWIQQEIYPTPLNKVLTPAEIVKYKGRVSNGIYTELKQLVMQRLS